MQSAILRSTAPGINEFRDGAKSQAEFLFGEPCMKWALLTCSGDFD